MTARKAKKRRKPAAPWCVRAQDDRGQRLALEDMRVEFDELYVGAPTWFGMERLDTGVWAIWVYTGGPDHERLYLSVTIPSNPDKRVTVVVVEGGELLER